MTIYDMVTELCRPRQACSELFRLHRWEKRKRLFLDRTLTQMEGEQDLPSLFRRTSNQSISLLHSERSSPSINETSDIQLHLTVTSQHGRSEESFSGTPFLVAELVSLYLTTGLTAAGTTSPEKSSNDATNKVSSSPFLEVSRSDISPRSEPLRSFFHRTPPREDH